MARHRALRSAAIAAGLALIASACAPTLGSYRFESVERVAREAIAAPESFEPKQAPHPWYLRVHFSSETNLNALAEERDEILARADQCPLRDPQGVAVLGPYAVGQALSVRTRAADGTVAGLARVYDKTPDGRYAYTAYVIPRREGAAAYDLQAAPRDLCLRLDAEGGPRGPERSNVFVAPAEAIRAALASTH